LLGAGRNFCNGAAVSWHSSGNPEALAIAPFGIIELSAMGSFGQNAGRVRGASRRVEIADRELAPRQRAALVAVDRRKLSGELGIVRRLDDQLARGPPRADEIDLGGGDAASCRLTSAGRCSVARWRGWRAASRR